MDRSKSYAGAGRMQIEPYYGGGGVGAGARPDFRSLSYSAGGGGGGAMSSYAYQYEFGAGAEDVNRGSSKSKRGRWLPLGDPDMDRKRRVASYKAYAVEGRVKGSFRKSFKWIKDRYLHLVYFDRHNFSQSCWCCCCCFELPIFSSLSLSLRSLCSLGAFGFFFLMVL
jgi:hypothetical protein